MLILWRKWLVMVYLLFFFPMVLGAACSSSVSTPGVFLFCASIDDSKLLSIELGEHKICYVKKGDVVRLDTDGNPMKLTDGKAVFFDLQQVLLLTKGYLLAVHADKRMRLFDNQGMWVGKFVDYNGKEATDIASIFLHDFFDRITFLYTNSIEGGVLYSIMLSSS